MDTIPLGVRLHKKRLSPFGQKVLNVLIEQWRSEKCYNIRQNQHEYNYLDQFGCSRNTKKNVSLDISGQNNNDHKKCTLKFLDKKSFDPFNVNSEPEDNNIFLRDDLVTFIKGESHHNITNACKSLELNELNHTQGDARDTINNSISAPEFSSNQKITWSNMLDVDLLDGIDGSLDNTELCDRLAKKPLVSFQNHEDQEMSVGEFKIPKKRSAKRKTTPQIGEMETVVGPVLKNIYRKEKFTTTVKNWLNDVGQTPADVINADNEQVINDDKSYLYFNRIGYLQCGAKANFTKEFSPEKSKQERRIIKKNKDSKLVENRKKKIIQAQLANKDGKMKFGKPKYKALETDINVSELSSATTFEPNREAGKDKKTKSKFVVPVKSQIPVKDVNYNVITLDANNVVRYEASLQSIKNTQVFLVLVYRNGFCQLNGCYSEDTCVPEGLLVGFADGDDFYYFTNINESLRIILTHILEHNVLVCYEGKSILIFLIDCNINFRPKSIEDAKIAAALLDPENLSETFSDLQKLVGYKPKFTITNDSSLQKAAWYITLLRDCSAKLMAQLVENSMWKVFVDIEMKLLPVIAEMESRGVAVDMEKLRSMEELIITKLKAVEQKCYQTAGKTFQINSTPQVRALLFDELKLDTKCDVRIRETLVMGAKSTSEDTLRSLMTVHPLPKLILEYRHLHKAHATFLTGIAQHVKDGIVRPNWIQIAAATGRMASTNPNLQAIPKAPFSLTMFPESGDDDNPVLNFRSVYVSRPGYTLLSADFKHVECRVFAHAAGDTTLQAALNSDDLFRVLAAKWLNVSEDEVSTADRERTKRVVYGGLYGCGARKLMDVLGVSYDHALQVLASFNRTFPSLKSFGRSVVSQCRESGGRLTTIFGRGRTFKNIFSQDFAVKSQAERQAVNFIVQGAAADACKAGMARAAARLGARARLLLQIHDELVWEVQDHHLHHLAGVVKEAMEGAGAAGGAGGAGGLAARFPVALSAGRNWGCMVPLIL